MQMQVHFAYDHNDSLISLCNIIHSTLVLPFAAGLEIMKIHHSAMQPNHFCKYLCSPSKLNKKIFIDSFYASVSVVVFASECRLNREQWNRNKHAPNIFLNFFSSLFRRNKSKIMNKTTTNIYISRALKFRQDPTWSAVSFWYQLVFFFLILSALLYYWQR